MQRKPKVQKASPKERKSERSENDNRRKEEEMGKNPGELEVRSRNGKTMTIWEKKKSQKTPTVQLQVRAKNWKAIYERVYDFFIGQVSTGQRSDSQGLVCIIIEITKTKTKRRMEAIIGNKKKKREIK